MTSDNNLYDAVIVGGGPAGLAAALYLARARYRVVVVEKDHFGGQITITSEIVNYPGVPRASGRELADSMRMQAESFGAEFLLAEVTGFDMGADVKVAHTTQGDLRCFGVLLATGAHPRKIGFEGEDEFRGRGVAYCATCDGEFFQGKEIFAVGGGFTAAEESVFLTKYASHVTILMRSNDFSCARATSEEARGHGKITILPHTQLEGVSGDSAVRSVRYRDTVTGEVTKRHASEGDSFGIFVFAGYEPETDLVNTLVELDERGYIVTDERQRSTVGGLYAAGDVCAKSLRQVVTATGEAALAATEMERYLATMQQKTGLMPERPKGVSGSKDAEAGGPGGDRPSPEGTPRGKTETSVDGGLFSPDMVAQLRAVFSRMESSLVLRAVLDGRPVSAELRAYLEELARLTDRVSLRVEDGTDDPVPDGQEADVLLPFVQVLKADGAPTGLSFHGVPGGHEFTSFVLGLYNAAGPGQPIDDASRKAIAAIDRPVGLKVLVSLSCTMCPDTVVAAQRIAAGNPNVTADVFDLAHFPALRDRYNVMSVPCLVVNEGEQVSFGRKNVGQVLELVS